MFYRDSSLATHYSRGNAFGVDSSHGVKIEGGSTGGVIQAIGDDTDISITLKGKGAGGVFLGAGTGSIGGYLRVTDTAVATPNFATTNAMVMETTHTITGLPAATAGATTNAFITAMAHNLSTDCALVGVYVGSTAGQAHCRFAKVSTVTVSASTATISFLVTL
jgi:hypothetical protein